jgi:hypothetical protein
MQTITDIKSLKGLSGKKILYVVTLHTFNTSNRFINFAINVEWKNAHLEIKQYLTDLLNELGKAQLSFLLPYEQCVMISCVLVPTFMNDHLRKNMVIRKNFKLMIPFELLCSDDELEDTKKCIDIFNNVVNMNGIYDGTKFYNDIKMNQYCNWIKTIQDLSRDSTKLKDSSLLYAISMNKMINIIIKKSESLEIHCEELKIIKRKTKINLTIIDRLKRWLRKSRESIQRKIMMVRTKRPRKIAPKRPDLINEIKPKKIYDWRGWTQTRTNLIIQQDLVTSFFSNFTRTNIRCVDDIWLRKNKFNRKITIIKQNCNKEDYLKSRDRFFKLKPHLRSMLYHDELVYLVKFGINEEQKNVLVFRWLNLFI